MPVLSKPAYETLFNGFIGTLPSIQRFLKETYGRLGKPVGHRYLDKLIIYDGVSFRQRDITMSFRDMVSGIDVSEIESLLNDYSSQSGYINNVQFQLLNGDVNLKLSGDYQVIAITNQTNGGYFDLQAFVQGQFLTYANTDVSNMEHSGDIHCTNRLLVHHIDLKRGTSGQVLFGAVGFRKKQLCTFVEQSPVVVIVDHENGIGYVVPCPLDRLTLGNATLSMFLKGTLHEHEGEKYCNFSCLQTPIVHEDVDTGELPESLREKLTNTNVQVVHHESNDDVLIADKSNDLPAIESQSSNGLFHFYAGNHTGFSEKMRPVNIFPGIHSEENPFIPSVFEYLLGLQGMHGFPFDFDGITTFYDIRNGKFIFEMDNSIPLYHEVMKSFKKMGNGLFIIHLTDEEMSDLPSLKMKILDIVGPRAYVVLENQGLYFYYRGISIPGFTPMMLGEQIHHFEARLQEWIDSPQLWDSISLKIDDRAYIPNLGFVSAQEFLNADFNLSDLISVDESKIRILEDVLTQFSICCDVKTLDKITLRVLEVIEQCQQKDIETCETQMSQIMQSDSLDIEAVRELREKKQPWQRLLQLVRRTVSLQGVISQKTTVEREKRRLQIMSNVNVALDMPLGDFFEKLESSCSTDGIIIASLEPGAFVKILEEITKHNTDHKGETIVSSKFGFHLSKILQRNMLKPNHRCPKLDADVFADCAVAMMKQGSAIYEFAYVEGSLVLCGICHEPLTLPLPMFEQLCGLSNPYVSWKELANDAMISTWRIKFRSTLTKLRDFDIKSDCTCLGASISLMLLVLIENYVSSKTSIPDEDSSELRVVRGLLGLLFTTAASGMNSQIKFWEIFSDGPFSYVPDTMEELELYKRVLNVSCFAGWVSEYTLQRYKKLVGQVLAGENCKDLIA
jgi:hypothetical protein